MFITRPSTNLLGGTEIDHILHTSPTMVLSQYDTGAGGLWIGMSDHRPVLASYSGIVAPGSRPRFTNVFSQARSLHLSRFRPSIKQLRDYQAGLDASWVRLDGPPPSLAQAEAHLHHLTTISLDSSPPSRNGRFGINTKNIGVLLTPLFKPSSWQ